MLGLSGDDLLAASSNFNIGGFNVGGVQQVNNRVLELNILTISRGSGGTPSSFVNALEQTARQSGATSISIRGSEIINSGFLNPRVASRFGFSSQNLGNNSVLFTRPLQ